VRLRVRALCYTAGHGALEGLPWMHAGLNDSCQLSMRCRLEPGCAEGYKLPMHRRTEREIFVMVSVEAQAARAQPTPWKSSMFTYSPPNWQTAALH
jgi:hypothetical protein